MLDRIIEEAPRFFSYYNLIFPGQAALAFGSILVLYFALSYPLTKLGQRVEARLAAR